MRPIPGAPKRLTISRASVFEDSVALFKQRDFDFTVPIKITFDMARNGGHQAVRRVGSCFLDNSVIYTDQWFSLANTKWLFIFTSIAQ
jgi:hypothetical protein